MIRRLKKNNMGTTDFMGRFTGMRKEQDFIVYPMPDAGTTIQVQSDTRFGEIDLESGAVVMSKPRAGGAGFMALSIDKGLKRAVGDILPVEELETLKGFIRASGSVELVGTAGVVTDNTGALFV